jgi:dUTP pyrophosphatase
VIVRFKKTRPEAIVPKYQRDGDSGLDLHACGTFTLSPGQTQLIPCGIGIELQPGFEAQVRGRSGLSKRGIWSALGTIDSNYRGEIAAVLHNLSGAPFVVNEGDRVAQLVIAKVEEVELEEAEELSETERGTAGFGSTGVAAGAR